MPGHGQGFEDAGSVDATLDYLGFVQAVAASGRDAGLTPLAAARETDLGRFAGWADAERIVGNLHRANAEPDGARRACPSTSPQLGDMVAYNSGVPLTCLT